MAAHKKKAAETGAHIVLIDETGFLLSPLVRRTYAPQGETPEISTRTRSREKVSVIAGLTISPHGRLGLQFMTLPDDHFDSLAVATFLTLLLRKIRGPVIVVWDRGPMHRGDPIREVLRRNPRLRLERLPPYSPKLNPVEQLWSLLKWGRLHNRPAADAEEIEKFVIDATLPMCKNQGVLYSLIAASELSPPDALIT